MRINDVGDCLSQINMRMKGEEGITPLPYWMLFTIRDCLLNEIRRLDAETKALPAILRGDNVTE